MQEASRNGSRLDLAENGGQGMDNDGDDNERPLLADPKERGMKRVGLVYSPRKSWWAGVVLIVLSIVIFVITIATAVL